ncbi:MAG: acetyltransferase [Cyclobacteriaceae bacterium]|nr:acetyltransferase [Cyclobacteriaceae bacterium]
MLILRQASVRDLELLQAWDEEPHVNKSDPNDDWNWETELSKAHSWRELLIAEADGVPMGFIQIINPAQEETQYWGEIAEGYRAIDIWIGPPGYLGKGYGTAMMQQALQRCFKHPDVMAVLIDPLVSNIRACRFYERLGFQYVEDRTFGEDDCRVYRFLRTDWEARSMAGWKPGN